MASSGKSVETQAEKQLRIKTGSLQRIKKELAAYEQEVEQQAAKVQRMRDEQQDEYDIKKQTEVLAESEMMIPNTKQRMMAAADALSTFIDSNEDAIGSSKKLDEAKALLADILGEPGAAGGDEEEI